MLKTYLKQINRESVLMIVGVLLWHFLVYQIARWITGGWTHYDITTAFDRNIPFVPWTIVIYFGCYIVWGIYYFVCMSKTNAERSRFILADMFAELVCFLIFLLLPTFNVRPEVTGDGIFDQLMRFLYWVDDADNLFPSMHCLTSWMCWVGVRKKKQFPMAFRLAALLAAIAVCISTLTTYQHVIADVFGGILLAELSYALLGIKGFRKLREGFEKTILLRLEQRTLRKNVK